MIFIFIGGGLGALSRHYVYNITAQFTGSLMLWGTLTVNLSGSFLIGIFFQLMEYTLQHPSDLRSLLLIGFLGAYTTFSTYSLENYHLLKQGQIKLFLLNILLNNILGIIMVVLGIFSVKLGYRLFIK
ncbi:MAG: fluoride efflux transporter CrcB [Candidatus Margulisbacteria bacterium]|nr:fluoride efflux transporter CrcB [Candidatus Margulisiibacteriota bacterium]